MGQEEAEWVSVTRRSPLCARRLQRRAYGNKQPLIRGSPLPLSAIQAELGNLSRSSFWEELSSTSLGAAPRLSVPSLICLGVGSSEVGDPAVFCAQAALAVLLKDLFGIPATQTWVSDPLMSSHDTRLFEALGLIASSSEGASERVSSFQQKIARAPPLQQWDMGKQAACVDLPPLCGAGSPVILFMPHCEVSVYDECLRLLGNRKCDCSQKEKAANPTAATFLGGGSKNKLVDYSDSAQCWCGLKNVVLVGNDLRQYEWFIRNALSAPPLQGAAPFECLRYLVPRLTSVPVRAKYPRCPTAFNDLYVTTFVINAAKY